MVSAPDKNFFVIDSMTLDRVESGLYGYLIDECGYHTGVYRGDSTSRNGCYVNVSVGEDSIKIQQDSNGSFGLYLYCCEGYFAISNSFFRLQDLIKKNHVISANMDYLRHLFPAGLCSLAYEETAINEIKWLDRNATVFIDKKNKTLRIEIDSEEVNTIPLESEEGLAILDDWFERWMGVIREIQVGGHRLSANLSGGFDSRLTFSLAVASGCDLKAINVFSMVSDNKVHQEDYAIAEKIARHFGFKLNAHPFPPSKASAFSLSQIVELAFDTKMMFHQDVHFKPGRQNDILYQLPGVGGELIRSYWNMSPNEIMDNYRKRALAFGDSVSEVFRSAVENVISRSMSHVCRKYALSESSPLVGHYLYRETRCRNHFGRAMVEDMAAGVFWIAPLLDKELHRLKMNFNGSADDNSLLALIFTRYCPDMLGFPVEGGRRIDDATIKMARELCKNHPYSCQRISTPSPVKCSCPIREASSDVNVAKPFLPADDVDDYFKRIVLSERAKNAISKVFSEEVYNWLLLQMDRSGFLPIKPWYGMSAILRLFENIDLSKRNMQTACSMLDAYAIGCESFTLPSEKLPVDRVLDVLPNSSVNVSGAIVCGGSGQPPRTAVLLRVNFIDCNGSPIRTEGWNFNDLYGAWKYVPVSDRAQKFGFVIPVPNGAKKVKVSISRFKCLFTIRVWGYSVSLLTHNGDGMVGCTGAESR